MLGGGTWTAQNKVMPGAYVNYISVQRAGINLSDRGICALPIELNWGADGKVFEVDAESLGDVALSVFGYSQDADEMKPIREVFRHATKCLFYRLNSGTKAECTLSTAKYTGTRGNDIKHVVTANIDDESKFDVSTYIGTAKVDTQTVATAAELVENAYVTFKKDATIEITAGLNLTGGANGEVTGTEHQNALKALEPYSFNILGCMSDMESIKAVYAAFTKRMRDEVGAKFQTVIHNLASDYIGIINVKNTVEDTGASASALIPWVAGAEAGCAINKTVENMTYDGECTIKADYTQTELKNAIAAGEFVFHKVGADINVLSDINSFVSVTNEMNEDFQLNQVVRVLDQIATDVAVTFNKRYLGKVQNDTDGRISLWNDIVDAHKSYQNLRAIEDFKSDDVVVEKGEGKRDVLVSTAVTPVCSMSKLYMSVYVG